MTPDQHDQALEIAADFMSRDGIEGVFLAPYLCPAKVATIGIGSTVYEDGRRVTLKDPPITRERAVALCAHHLRKRCLPKVLKWCPELDTPRRMAAVLSWAYNVGVETRQDGTDNLETSTMRRAINRRAWSDAAAGLKMWNKASGRTLPGLVTRRALEAEMLVSG